MKKEIDMKDIFNNKLCYMLVALAGFCFSSCSSDTEVDPYDINYAYTSQPAIANHNIAYLKDGSIVKAPDQVENTSVVARCTKPAPSDITVTYTIDKSLVDSYSKSTSVEYSLLENVELVNPQLTIKAGKYVSDDSLKVRYKDMKEFTNGKVNYLLPIVMKTISGGVTLSEQHVFYLTYKSEMKTTDLVNSPVGTLVDPSNWSLTIAGKNAAAALAKLLDNDEYTGVFCANMDVIFNFNEEITVSTIYLSFFWTNYTPNSAAISYSTDGATFTDVDNVSLVSASGDKNNENYIRLYSPVKAKYLKFVFPKAQSGTYLNKFAIYKK